MLAKEHICIYALAYGHRQQCGEGWGVEVVRAGCRGEGGTEELCFYFMLSHTILIKCFFALKM